MSEPLLPDWEWVANGLQGPPLKPKMTEAEYNFRLRWREYCTGRSWDRIDPDELRRELTVTPFDGSYGQAGVVLTINGSPPHCMMVVTTDQRAQDASIYVLRVPRPVVIREGYPVKAQELRRAVFALLREFGAVPASWETAR